MSTFAPVVSSRDRVEIDQIFNTGNANYNQATNNNTFLISAVIQFLKSNFEFQCVTPPLAPNKSQLCTNWKLVLV